MSYVKGTKHEDDDMDFEAVVHQLKMKTVMSFKDQKVDFTPARLALISAIYCAMIEEVIEEASGHAIDKKTTRKFIDYAIELFRKHSDKRD